MHRLVESFDYVAQFVDTFFVLADNTPHILHLVVQCRLFRGCKIAVAIAGYQFRLEILIDLVKKLLDLYKLISKLCEMVFNFEQQKTIQTKASIRVNKLKELLNLSFLQIWQYRPCQSQ